MTAPNPDDAGLLAKITAGLGAALSALGAWAWHHTHKRIDEKAGKEAFDRLSEKVETHMITRREFAEHVRSDETQMDTITEELKIQRGHVGKIFEQMRDMEERGHDRHVELLNAIKK